MGLPEMPPVGEELDIEQTAPELGNHEGCPFFDSGKCLVLNENVRELGKNDAAEYNEDGDRDEDEELSDY